jgi:hypothetical protein
MEKENLRRWVLERLENLSAKVQEFENLIDLGMSVTQDERRNLHIQCHEMQGEKNVLHQLYDDFNLEDTHEN